MIIEVQGLRFSYDSRPVLDGVSFRVSPGEVCAVLGNNGAGKSTLLRCMARILRFHTGVVHLDGRNISGIPGRELARRLGYVPQRREAPSRLTVFDAVLQGRKPYISWAAGSYDLEVVEKTLQSMHMREFSLRYLDELSGGELQKVMIARALAQEPGVLLLDEPTSDLDLRNQLEVMRLVSSTARERAMAVVVAIHDLNLSMRFSHRFLLLCRGKIQAAGGKEVLTPENIEETYGVKVRVEDVGGVRMVVPVFGP